MNVLVNKLRYLYLFLLFSFLNHLLYHVSLIIFVEYHFDIMYLSISHISYDAQLAMSSSLSLILCFIILITADLSIFCSLLLKNGGNWIMIIRKMHYLLSNLSRNDWLIYLFL